MARQTPGNYVPLDVNYARDVAIRKAGPNAELLYIRSLAYAKGSRTGGFVSDYDLDVVGIGLRGIKLSAKRLVEVGLWERVEDGWMIRSWERWNASEKIVSAGGKLGNHKRWHADRGQFDPECEHCAEHPPIAPRSHPDSPPTSPPESQGKGREVKTPPCPPNDTSAHPQTVVDPSSAQAVVSDWIDTLKRRPPGSVIGQVAKIVKTLLGEGFSPTEIGQALAVMSTKGLNPSTLPALVNEVVNKSNVRAIRSGVATSADGSRVKWVKPTEKSRWREAYSDEVCVGMYKIKYMNAGEQPA
jgi:hypothetical protein